MSADTVLQAIRRITGLSPVLGILNVLLPQPLQAELPVYVTEEDLGGV